MTYMNLDDKNKKYSLYSVEDFLQDDYFITSVIKPTEQSDNFWYQLIESGKINIDDYRLARYFITSVQLQPEKISKEEAFVLWEDIEIRNKQNLKKKKSFYLFISSIAAMVALFVFILFLKDFSDELAAEKYSSYTIEDIKGPETQDDEIQLILAENEMISLKDEEAEIIYSEAGIAINNKNTNLNKNINQSNNQVIYDQLIVPSGKRSMLTLADDTRIWVNARTRIVYPTKFNDKKREIFVDGEAYLEVSFNKNSPFIVKTKEMEVEVLGTSFNIMAYETDSLKRIVLVSGSVKVNIEDKKEMLLTPAEMLTLTQGETYINSVNTYNYTSWRDGLYQYESEKLDVILKRLSRYYGKEIECSTSASNFKCSGKLQLKDNLLQVINGISKTVPIQYSYRDGKYLITNN